MIQIVCTTHLTIILRAFLRIGIGVIPATNLDHQQRRLSQNIRLRTRKKHHHIRECAPGFA